VAEPEHRRAHNQKSMQRLLEANGWTATVGGKHQVKMTKPGHWPITLPMNHGRDYPAGLAVAIMRQAGLRGRGE
jgi:predicted RNA binding protein YcfA (HicA-like mRNA interferase family)